ncbi:MAG: hypothetical protein QXP70_02355 [Methanomassiliicoccales archaeon]
MSLSYYYLIFCLLLPGIILALLVYFNENIFYIILDLTYILATMFAFFPRQTKT